MAQPAFSEALLARLGESLKRVETQLLALQKPDGRWDTPFVAGSYHMALGILALVAVGDAAILTQGKSVIGRFARDQASDGGFSITAGEPSNRAATRLVILTIQQLVRRQPSLGDAAKTVLEKARAFLQRDRSQSGFDGGDSPSTSPRRRTACSRISKNRVVGARSTRRRTPRPAPTAHATSPSQPSMTPPAPTSRRG